MKVISFRFSESFHPETLYSTERQFFLNFGGSPSTQNSRRIVAQLSTKFLGGSFLKIGKKSLSLTRKGLASSS
jgi:hypothetical protein